MERSRRVHQCYLSQKESHVDIQCNNRILAQKAYRTHVTCHIYLEHATGDLAQYSVYLIYFISLFHLLRSFHFAIQLP